MIRGLARDDAVVVDVRKVAHAAQHPVRDARRPARARRDLQRALRVDLDAEQRRRARHDPRQLFLRIKLQTELNAEAVAQRAGQLPRARRRADEREARQIEPDGIGRRALADDDVDGIVLHRRI